MNRYGVIIVSSDPKGRFDEVVLDSITYPGQCVTLKAGVEPVAGKFRYEHFNRAADGGRAPVCVVLENELEGKDPEQPWAAGKQARVYFPAQGEFLQMLVKNESGTGDSHEIGDQFIIEDGSGKLIPHDGNPQSVPFECLETQEALTADTLVLCKYTGY